LDGQPLRSFGSRGQVRTLVLALKLAELLAAHARGDRPLFLLDDLSSELDRARTGRLVGVLGELDAQVWVTTTDPDHLGQLPGGEVARVVLQGGRAVLGGS
jgi:DNA replication and repair protein RecF